MEGESGPKIRPLDRAGLQQLEKKNLRNARRICRFDTTLQIVRFKHHTPLSMQNSKHGGTHLLDHPMKAIIL